jgi:hypothetical protein
MKPKAKEHDSYTSFTVIAVLLPWIGLILGIVYLTKDKQLDKKLGEHLLSISVLFILIWSTISYFFLFNSTPQTITVTTPTETQTENLNIDNSEQKDILREARLKALASNLEVYYAVNGYYPTLTNINNVTWRSENLSGLNTDDSALKDPDGNSNSLSSSPKAGYIAYAPGPDKCDNLSNKCTTFKLTTILSSGDKKVVTNL